MLRQATIVTKIMLNLSSLLLQEQQLRAYLKIATKRFLSFVGEVGLHFLPTPLYHSTVPGWESTITVLVTLHRGYANMNQHLHGAFIRRYDRVSYSSHCTTDVYGIVCNYDVTYSYSGEFTASNTSQLCYSTPYVYRWRSGSLDEHFTLRCIDRSWYQAVYTNSPLLEHP